MKNNQFKFRTLYDEFLQKQDASKASIKPQSKARSTAAVDSSTSSNSWYDSRLGKQQDWDEITKKYNSLKGDYSADDSNMDNSIKNWGDNYGSSASGNIFADDWTWKKDSDLDVYAGDSWEQGRGLARQYTQEQSKVNRQYDDIINAADREQQRASISKAHSLRNAIQANSVLGRGGQGIDESMRRNLDMNYNNTLNSLNTDVNRDVQSMYNDWLERVGGFSEAHRKIETGAKNNYNTALHKDMMTDTDRWLRGDEESGIAPEYEEYTYTDANGKELSYSMLGANKEKEYLDDLAKRNQDYKYFLNSQRDKDLYQQYVSDIKQVGSENDEYKKHQADKVLQENRANAENYDMRGAVANVSNADMKIFSEKDDAKKLAPYGAQVRRLNWNKDNPVSINKKNYIYDNDFLSGDYKKYNKFLEKNAPDKIKGTISGDVIYYDKNGAEDYYIKDYNGKWFKLKEKK